MKVLFFSPHSAIWVHAFPEALVAEALQQSGHQIVYVTCGQVLEDQCVAMSAAGIGSQNTRRERRQVCKRCTNLKMLLRRDFGLPGRDMSAMLEEDGLRRVDEILADLNRTNAVELTIDGVPVGRYALYELILHRKKDTLAIGEDEWPEYRAAIRGALMALFSGQKILAEERPDRLVTYNTMYPVNRVMWHLAARQGVTTYFLHAGTNLSRRLRTLIISRDATFPFCKHLIAEWPRFRHKPVLPEIVDQIRAHLLVLFRGHSVFGYSSGVQKGSFDAHERFGVSAGQRLLVAGTSSPDERFASETIGVSSWEGPNPFPTQVEWIQSLVRFVGSRPDLFLVIRVHPREFPNKRESAKSAHAFLLEEALRSLPDNVRVNWPTDNIALYDLANRTDVFLNAWSSTGKDMALLGIPVVSYYGGGLLYPPDLNYVATTESEYFRVIDEALEDGWSFERSRLVFRWLALEFNHGLVEIADGYPVKETNRKGVLQKLEHRVRTVFNKYYVQNADCRTRPTELANRRMIDAIISNKAWSPLDECLGFDIPHADRESETKAIRSALLALGEEIFAPDSHLQEGTLASKFAALAQAQV
jgi:hypothetical protein